LSCINNLDMKKIVFNIRKTSYNLYKWKELDNGIRLKIGFDSIDSPGRIVRLEFIDWEKEDAKKWIDNNHPYLKTFRIHKIHDLIITSLGSWAAYGKSGKKHFSLLIEWKGKKIWLDPSVNYNDKVDLILLSSPDKDHYLYLDKYLKKHPNTEVYSTKSVIKLIDTKFKDNLKPIKKPFSIDGLKIIVISIPLMVGKPACAFKIEAGKYDIGIVPEYDRLGKQEKLYLKNTILIVGVGEYDTRKKNDHKATFTELLELLKEIEPKSVYITNKRTSLVKHSKEIEEFLKEYKGKILKDGNKIVLKGDKINVVEKIKDFTDYNPSKMTSEQLADDLRLIVAYVSKKIEWEEW